MKDFFAAMYEFFISLYGEDLGLHLYGHNGDAYENNGGEALYVPIGVAMILSNMVVAAIFYYLINRPNFNRWYHWLTMLMIAASVNGLVGYYLPYLDVDANRIAADLTIDAGNCMGFGLVNGLYSAIVFFLASLVLKIWSRNCSSTPF